MKPPGPKFWWSATFTVIVAIIIFLLMKFARLPLWLAWFGSATGITALAFFIDKSRAVKDVNAENPARRRIPEATLLYLCFIGGTLGGIAVMLGKRHKTRDRKFLLLLLAIIIIQALMLGFLLARTFYAADHAA